MHTHRLRFIKTRKLYPKLKIKSDPANMRAYYNQKQSADIEREEIYVYEDDVDTEKSYHELLHVPIQVLHGDEENTEKSY